MSAALLTDLTIFVLALLIGIEVIGKVPATLHTPLMSATNAIHGIVLVGALLIGVTAHTWVGYTLGFVAAVFAGANVVGGYVVTGRMLKMFRKKALQPECIAAGTRITRRSQGPQGPGGPGRHRQGPVMTGFSGHVGFAGYIQLVYVLAAVLFVVGLHLMNSPATARRGNQVAQVGMIIAVIATFVLMIHAGTVTTTGWIVLLAGALIGSGVGLFAAQKVQMTAMPQLVSAFNAVGGGAAALVAIFGYYDAESAGHVLGTTSVFSVLDVLIGSVTFSGSIIAAGKLQGFIGGQPIIFKGGRLLNIALAVVALGSGAYLFTTPSLPALLIVVLASLGFGIMMVLPIGGADMPVVISLLNAFTGTAVAMAGFVIQNWALIVAGALVGASGSILTKLMADAMNRSLANIIIGGFGTGDSAVAIGGPIDAQVRSVAADDAAIQLAYASKVIIVPGYGLAAAQAQHGVAELAKTLEEHGVEVSYAIHPVAGRMPGHMNVLLAEANVPYPQLVEMDEINPEFARTDVALVIGANDVTNPAARRPGNEISGMPILDVDQAKSIIVIKRSMGHGYAGLENELYYDPKTSMFFADAKKAMTELTSAVKTLVA